MGPTSEHNLDLGYALLRFLLARPEQKDIERAFNKIKDILQAVPLRDAAYVE